MLNLLDRFTQRLFNCNDSLWWLLGLAVVFGASSVGAVVTASEPVVETIRSFTVGENLQDLQDPTDLLIHV